MACREDDVALVGVDLSAKTDPPDKSYGAPFCHPARARFAPVGHLGELTGIVPPEMVDAALEAGGKEQRRRRLPSRVVVYLLLAGALFAEQGWQQVWSRLTSGLAAPIRRPSKSSITQAMRRVGPGPLRELFTLLAGPAPARSGQAVRFAGRLVLAIDGTQIPVADTDANQAAFPKPRPGPNGGAGCRFLRLVALLACGTRTIIEAAFGSDRVGELAYARQLTGALGPGMLLLEDRNFAAYQLFTDIAGAGADFLIRAKNGNGAMQLGSLGQLPDGSYLARARGLTVRVIDAQAAITTAAGTRTGDYRLTTTLTDPDEAPAQHLVRLYHERWEIESAYCELKSTILAGRMLRGKHPAAVTQEVWALLAAYQILRIAISDTALASPGIDPDRLSFTTALRTARDHVVQASHLITGTTINLVGRIGVAPLNEVMPARRTRTRQRVIKRAISKYQAKSRDTDRRTHPATLHTKILTSRPDG